MGERALIVLQVYSGYVDDPRNTDNSWMETVAVNFHDDTGNGAGRFHLHAGASLHTCIGDMCKIGQAVVN